jgi:NDP-sugar pyrophosphorylase family protein
MGIYVYEPDVVTHMPDGHFDFPEVVAALLAEGEKVIAYPFDGVWYDFGTPSDHERATAALARLERTDA